MAVEQANIEYRLGFIERRAMNDNIKPHEAVRQLMQVLDDFQVSGDVTWPLRSIRDISLDYLRAISMRYPNMSENEKNYLARLTFFEVVKRTVRSLQGNERGLQTQAMTVALCEGIERAEQSCTRARLFPEGALSNDTVEMGYEKSEAYNWLRQKRGP